MRAVEAMAREMHRAVDEVGAVVSEAGIDCGFHRGGAIYFATNQGEPRRVHAYHAHHEKHGLGDAWRLLDAEQAAAIVHVPGILGATSPRMRPPCTRLGRPGDRDPRHSCPTVHGVELWSGEGVRDPNGEVTIACAAETGRQVMTSLVP